MLAFVSSGQESEAQVLALVAWQTSASGWHDHRGSDRKRKDMAAPAANHGTTTRVKVLALSVRVRCARLDKVRQNADRGADDQ